MSGPKKSKKRPLRPPFLITVATFAGALVPGCGGAVSTDAAGPDGGPNADCPAVQPANGLSCAISGQACEYAGCAGPIQLKCVAGKWSQQTFGSCNPPPPVSECPLAEPEAETDCFAVTPRACSYPKLCCGVSVGTSYYACSTPRLKWGKTENVVDAAACGPCGDAGACDSCPDVTDPPESGSD